MKSLISMRSLISALMTLFSICMMFVMSSEAKAADFELNMSLDGLYWQDTVWTNEYRDSYDMGAFGLSIEPIARFSDLYSLGLDVSIGGSSLGDSSDHWHDDDDYSEIGVMLQIYITNKFIYSDDNYELWGELGLGGHWLFANGFYGDEGDILAGGLWLGLRVRLGMTYYIGDMVGVGLHANGSCYNIISGMSFGGGIHTTIRF